MNHLNDLKDLLSKVHPSLKEAHSEMIKNATEEDRVKIQSIINKEINKSIEMSRIATKGTPLEGVDIMGSFLKGIYK